jgi:hypothetical protein
VRAHTRERDRLHFKKLLYLRRFYRNFIHRFSGDGIFQKKRKTEVAKELLFRERGRQVVVIKGRKHRTYCWRFCKTRGRRKKRTEGKEEQSQQKGVFHFLPVRRMVIPLAKEVRKGFSFFFEEGAGEVFCFSFRAAITFFAWGARVTPTTEPIAPPIMIPFTILSTLFPICFCGFLNMDNGGKEGNVASP